MGGEAPPRPQHKSLTVTMRDKQALVLRETPWVSTGNSHIIDLDVAVIRGGDKELRVRGKGQGADGHSMA